MSAVVQAHEVSKWFGEVVAVNNLSLEIGPGITGLLGPNGAGKSTFMKLALGLHAPSRGSLSVLGEAPRNNLSVLRRIGYCPETDHFYDNTTGFEFVYWLTRYGGLPHAAATRAAEHACGIVRMTERMHDPIDEYSKGMRQRIKIAQALALGPELLFLDEPMSGLDPQGREEMYALIRQLGRQGLSVIVSSHILYEVERITNNVVLLYNGTILAQGEVREIRELIDGHPHTIIVETADVRGVSRHFVEEPSTMSMEFTEDKLVLRTSDPNRCFERLNELALENAVPIRSITCVDDDLQSVFDYLVHS